MQIKQKSETSKHKILIIRQIKETDRSWCIHLYHETDRQIYIFIKHNNNYKVKTVKVKHLTNQYHLFVDRNNCTVTPWTDLLSECSPQQRLGKDNIIVCPNKK